MQIRTKLVLQFLLLAGTIMIVSSIAIYYSSSSYRKDDFYSRLRNRARSTARLLLDANTIDPELVKRIEMDNPLNLHNEKVIIINFLGDTIFSTDYQNRIKIRNDVLERVRLGKKVYYTQRPYDVLGTLYYAKYDRFVVIAAAIDVEGHAHLEKLRMVLVFVCVVSMLMFVVAGWFYADRALKPITDVVKKVEEISITSLNLRVNEGKGIDEIGSLAKTFNKMLERLETSFAMQKDFIANASHELRTPLTSIHGQLEVLLMKERNTDEYRSALTSVLDDIKSLTDLSNRLLLIARTSAEGPMHFTKNIRIDEILWQAKDEIRRFKNDYNIQITLGNAFTEAEQMTVAGDEYLLKVALANIMDNACKYSPDHTVDIFLTPVENNVEIVFEDKGIGIAVEDLQKVFEPFYRGFNVLGMPGSGIGLPLVNQIIKIHNGKIELTSQVGAGTRFKILLPTI